MKFGSEYRKTINFSTWFSSHSLGEIFKFKGFLRNCRESTVCPMYLIMTTPDETFSKFLELPSEIQLLIWDQAVQDLEKRVIHVGNWRRCRLLPPLMNFWSSSPARHDPSPLLSACIDSRNRYLNVHFKLVPKFTVLYNTYFNPDKDILLFDAGQKSYETNHENIGSFAPKADLAKIRFLAMDFIGDFCKTPGMLLYRE